MRDSFMEEKGDLRTGVDRDRTVSMIGTVSMNEETSAVLKRTFGIVTAILLHRCTTEDGMFLDYSTCSTQALTTSTSNVRTG